jgi:hypothetical protein
MSGSILPPPANSSCWRQHSGGSSNHIKGAGSTGGSAEGTEVQVQTGGDADEGGSGRRPASSQGETAPRGGGVWRWGSTRRPTMGRNADHAFWMGQCSRCSSIQSRNTPVMWTRAAGGDCLGVFFFYKVNALHVEFKEYRRGWKHFFTGMCTAVGGAFTCSSGGWGGWAAGGGCC